MTTIALDGPPVAVSRASLTVKDESTMMYSQAYIGYVEGVPHEFLVQGVYDNDATLDTSATPWTDTIAATFLAHGYAV